MAILTIFLKLNFDLIYFYIVRLLLSKTSIDEFMDIGRKRFVKIFVFENKNTTPLDRKP